MKVSDYIFLHINDFLSLQFTFPEKVYLSIQVCQAVMYLHTASPPMAHLDIKPANILVCWMNNLALMLIILLFNFLSLSSMVQVDSLTMHATLTDFGLAKAMSAVGTRTMLAGSPGYQAPEQLRAESLGPHCDIYAFGCVMIVLFQ